LLQITPKCDCKSFSEAPVCHDLGILASYDPVALDQASLDLVNYAVQKKLSRIQDQDVFATLHPNTDGQFTLELAEKLGLGCREYSLKVVQ
jgi:hypothetical protein